MSAARLPFLPEWVPVELVIGNTLAVEALLLSAIWWARTRRSARRSRALAFVLVPVTIAITGLLAVDALGPTTWRARDFSCSVRGWPRPPEHDDEIALQFSWEESALFHRVSHRRIDVSAHPCSYGTTVLVQPKGDQEVVSIELRHGKTMLTDEILDDLWRYHESEDTRATARAAWETIRASHLTRAYPELAELMELYP